MLTPNVPYPPNFGGSVRMFHLLKQLCARHTVHLCCLNPPDEHGQTGPLESLCESVTVINRPDAAKRCEQMKSLFSLRSFQYRSHHVPEMARAVRNLLERHEIDLILAEFSQMASFDFPPDIPLVIDQHNVEFDLIRRMAKQSPWSARKVYNLLEAAKFRREELKALGAASLVTATSKRDADLMESLVPGLQTRIVENGVDAEAFRNPGKTPTPNTVVFVGAMHYFPNVDAMHFYMQRIHPILARKAPTIRVLFVGGRPSETLRQYESEQVKVTGFVEDVRPYMHEASAFIVPLRMGGGTRFKVVEALAAGTPVVSTSIGSEGIPVENERELLLADEPEDFANAVVRVLRTPQLAESLRTNGLDFVKKNFDWRRIGDKLNNALEEARVPADSDETAA